MNEKGQAARSLRSLPSHGTPDRSSEGFSPKKPLIPTTAATYSERVCQGHSAAVVLGRVYPGQPFSVVSNGLPSAEGDKVTCRAGSTTWQISCDVCPTWSQTRLACAIAGIPPDSWTVAAWRIQQPGSRALAGNCSRQRPLQSAGRTSWEPS